MDKPRLFFMVMPPFCLVVALGSCVALIMSIINNQIAFTIPSMMGMIGFSVLGMTSSVIKSKIKEKENLDKQQRSG